MSHLTPQQQATLKAYIESDPMFASILASPQANSDKASSIALLLQGFPSPDYYVFRSSITRDEIRKAVFAGGGGTQIDALTASKRDTLFEVISEDIALDANMRALLDDLCGSQNTLKAAIQAALKRKANILEKLFATGNGALATPSTLGLEGTLDYVEVAAAMQWPV